MERRSLASILPLLLLLEFAGLAQAFLLGFQLSREPTMELKLYPYADRDSEPVDLTDCQPGPNEEVLAVGIINGGSQGVAASTKRRMTGIALWREPDCPPVMPDYIISWRDGVDGMQLADLDITGHTMTVGSWMDLDADNLYLQKAGTPHGYIYDPEADEKVYVEGGAPVVTNGERKTTKAAKAELIAKAGVIQRSYARDMQYIADGTGGVERIPTDNIPLPDEVPGNSNINVEPVASTGEQVEGGYANNIWSIGGNERESIIGGAPLGSQPVGTTSNQPLWSGGGGNPQNPGMNSNIFSNGRQGPGPGLGPGLGSIPHSTSGNMVMLQSYPNLNNYQPPQINPYQHQNMMSNPFPGFIQPLQVQYVPVNPQIYFSNQQQQPQRQQNPLLDLNRAPPPRQQQPGLQTPLRESLTHLGRSNPMAPVEEIERRADLLGQYLRNNDPALVEQILGNWPVAQPDPNSIFTGMFPDFQVKGEGLPKEETEQLNPGREEILEEIQMSREPEPNPGYVNNMGGRNWFDNSPYMAQQPQNNPRLQSQFRLYTGVEESMRPGQGYGDAYNNFPIPPSRQLATQESLARMLSDLYNAQRSLTGGLEFEQVSEDSNPNGRIPLEGEVIMSNGDTSVQPGIVEEQEFEVEYSPQDDGDFFADDEYAGGDSASPESEV
ncbi:hypothetical protein TWF730_004071 [Orbilia blumenaviensis]|uniref:Uncharacterized protein n=1 Tax=Orbilia blumenaviensis TaxID=1796055 RepID=A0AAV9U3Z8_9PEZI